MLVTIEWVPSHAIHINKNLYTAQRHQFAVILFLCYLIFMIHPGRINKWTRSGKKVHCMLSELSIESCVFVLHKSPLFCFEILTRNRFLCFELKSNGFFKVFFGVPHTLWIIWQIFKIKWTRYWQTSALLVGRSEYTECVQSSIPFRCYLYQIYANRLNFVITSHDQITTLNR